jgi:hypothetical protein
MISIIPGVTFMYRRGRHIWYAQGGFGTVKHVMDHVAVVDGRLTHETAFTGYRKAGISPAATALLGGRRKAGEGIAVYVEAGYLGAFTTEGTLSYVPLRLGVAMDLSGASGSSRVRPRPSP